MGILSRSGTGLPLCRMFSYAGQSNRSNEELNALKADTELKKARKQAFTGENENDEALDRLDSILKEIRSHATEQETE